MDKMAGIAYCGLDCNSCPALIATLGNDQDLRVKTAEIWSKQYNSNIRPEDVNCTGCSTPDGVKIAHCFECNVRLCALDRQVATCADCVDYICADLERFLEWVPAARETLEKLRG
jgi:hypothetical protein